ncbi:MAG TPA: PAS domain S-box protein [Candidatus Saccharimonadaceae bacterium]|nr:PAS domain S-box protein [Candidatus Saccharimonadaceae bacterium]
MASGASLAALVLAPVAAFLGGASLRSRRRRTPTDAQLALQSVLGSIRDGVIVADLKGNFVLVNAAAERIIGPDNPGVDPSQWSDYFGIFLADAITPYPPSDLPLARAMRGEVSEDVEMVLRRTRMPHDVWITVSGRPLRDPEGVLRGGMIVITDVTARKDSENAARLGQESFRSLVESIRDDATFMLDIEGRVSSWNQGAERMTGYSADEMLGQHVSKHYTANDLELGRPRDELAVAATTGRFECEEWRLRKNGSPYWAGVVVTSMLDQSGTLRGYMTVLSDLNAGLRTESRYRALLEATPDAILMVNQDGLIELANGQIEHLFGYTRAELLGASVEMLLPERFRHVHGDHRHGFFVSPRRRAMREGLDLFGLRKDGTEFPVEISLSPLETVDGVLALAAIRDGTERKRAQDELVLTIEKLKRSNAELEQFAYVTSHDLQEPLRMVASYTQLLAQRYKGRLGADADEFISFAVDGSTRMRQLIQDLLAYSRAGSSDEGILEISSEDALNEALANLEGAMKEGSAVVTHGPLPRLHMDPAQLEQIFQNLVGNAIKYRGAEPPRIHVTARYERGEGHVFSVQDNGLGIDAKHFERIFVIFQRLHGRDAYSGTGIGLAICKKLVERHGGRIWVESQPGHGSTFHFAIANGHQK